MRFSFDCRTRFASARSARMPRLRYDPRQFVRLHNASSKEAAGDWRSFTTAFAECARNLARGFCRGMLAPATGQPLAASGTSSRSIPSEPVRTPAAPYWIAGTAKGNHGDHDCDRLPMSAELREESAHRGAVHKQRHQQKDSADFVRRDIHLHPSTSRAQALQRLLKKGTDHSVPACKPQLHSPKSQWTERSVPFSSNLSQRQNTLDFL